MLSSYSKICQTVADIIITSQFHDFFSNFQKIHITSVSCQITCSLHIQNLSNCCRHNYNQVNFTIFFFEFHFWRRVFDIWSNCGGALMHNLSQVSSSTLGSQKAMFLHDEAIIMYLGLNCTHCTGPVWSPLSTQTLVPFSAFQMWTRPSVEPEITN